MTRNKGLHAVPLCQLQQNLSNKDYMEHLAKDDAAKLQDHLFSMLLSTVRDDRFELYTGAEREAFIEAYQTLQHLVVTNKIQSLERRELEAGLHKLTRKV